MDLCYSRVETKINTVDLVLAFERNLRVGQSDLALIPNVMHGDAPTMLLRVRIVQLDNVCQIWASYEPVVYDFYMLNPCISGMYDHRLKVPYLLNCDFLSLTI